jgi:hypothetical protein
MSLIKYLSLPFLILACYTASAGPHKVIDLKNYSDADGIEREISFCARPSPGGSNLPGHAFVAFSTVTPNKGRSYQAVGHTTSAGPATTLLTYFKIFPNVSGHLAEERYTDAKEKCLVVKVNKPDYEEAYSAARTPWAQSVPELTNPPTLLLAYRLGDDDCMSFMTGVASKFGGRLKLPKRGAVELPLPYLRRFIEAN